MQVENGWTEIRPLCLIKKLFNPFVTEVFNFFFKSELESSKKQAEADKKAIDDLVRERDILNKVFCCPILRLYGSYYDHLKLRCYH